MTPTKVLFPDFVESTTAKVLATVLVDGNNHAVFLDQTPFHPVDFKWPDQPGDRGLIRWNNIDIPVYGSIIATETDGKFTFDTEITADRFAETNYYVAHLVDDDSIDISIESLVAESVTVMVDSAYRKMLSQVHSCCHLMSLALNKSVEKYWTKPAPRRDSLDSPDLDSLAIDSSRIFPDHALDSYRFGKSLRKKGFSGASIFENMAEIEEEINSLVNTWIIEGGGAKIEKSSYSVCERRIWISTVEGSAVNIPCGGTHVSDLSQIGKARISLDKLDENHLQISTRLA